MEMLPRHYKKYLLNLLVLLVAVKSILANCMSARSQTNDADCYLNHLARENIMRMGMEGGCDEPRQQVVYPDDTSKMYMPRGKLPNDIIKLVFIYFEEHFCSDATTIPDAVPRKSTPVRRCKKKS